MATIITPFLWLLCIIPGIVCGFQLPPSSPAALPSCLVAGRVEKWQQQFCRERGLLWGTQGDDNDDEVDEDLRRTQPTPPSIDSKDDFLDQAFFDPDQVTEDDPAPVQWFANLVKNDYDSAEALYVGLFFALLVVLTQEVLRMQLYGANYVPFTSGKPSGTLF